MCLSRSERELRLRRREDLLRDLRERNVDGFREGLARRNALGDGALQHLRVDAGLHQELGGEVVPGDGQEQVLRLDDLRAALHRLKPCAREHKQRVIRVTLEHAGRV